jgi:hypothetical protein
MVNNVVGRLGEMDAIPVVYYGVSPYDVVIRRSKEPDTTPVACNIVLANAVAGRIKEIDAPKKVVYYAIHYYAVV